jgi:hypothetical protein
MGHSNRFRCKPINQAKLIGEHDHEQQGKQFADEMGKVTDKIVRHIIRGTTAENELFNDEAQDRYDKYVWVQGPSFYIMTWTWFTAALAQYARKSRLY